MSHREPRGARQVKDTQIMSAIPRTPSGYRLCVGRRMQATRGTREAQPSGDMVEMENCYQHAELYFRVMRGQGHERRS